MWYQRKNQSKYKSQSTLYNGRQYHSKFEASYAYDLDMQKKAGTIKDWEPQFKVSLDVNNKHICNYYVDFKVTNNDESIELVEVKGYETEVWRLKRKLLEATYLIENPNVSYVVIK